MTKDFENYKKNKNLKKQAGQILIIFLLVLVVGLALVLSVASRSITDIRITTSTDESNRAYFAAEAGVEEALKQLQKGPYTGGELDFTVVNQTKAKVNVGALSSGTGDAFLFPEQYDRDSVAQVNLLIDFNNPASATTVPPGTNLAIYYGNVGAITRPAIEVSIITTDTGANWGIRKFAFDQPGLRSNGFCDALGTTTIATQNETKEFANHVFLPLNGYPVPPGCPGENTILEGVVPPQKPVMARIRLLYNADGDPQPIAVGIDGAFSLPDQGTEVVSTGSTVSGVTRKLKVTKLFPSLPAIFDYVLFSGGDLVK